ncbi:MAG: hypothetical protein MR399_11430 [Clostridiales bacterium]|nr:hypothetical protein [Clostridiales bacterium]
MKRRWKRIFAGLLAALMLCMSPCFAAAPPMQEAPAVETFCFTRSGMSADQARSYQIRETARGRFVWIELYYSDHYVLPLTDEDMASFSALVQELELTAWNGYSEVDRYALDGECFSLDVAFEGGASISASGSNCFPQDYGEKMSAVEDFFRSLMADYELGDDVWR